jgi:hypothetical protein
MSDFNFNLLKILIKNTYKDAVVLISEDDEEPEKFSILLKNDEKNILSSLSFHKQIKFYEVKSIIDGVMKNQKENEDIEEKEEIECSICYKNGIEGGYKYFFGCVKCYKRICKVCCKKLDKDFYINKNSDITIMYACPFCRELNIYTNKNIYEKYF